MNFQKILLKIAYWLVALSILVLIGFTFYARHVITSQSQNAPVKKTEIEETSNIQVKGMSLSRDDEKAKKEIEELKEAMKKEEGGKTGE
jgi:peroxiredoxin family protein